MINSIASVRLASHMSPSSKQNPEVDIVKVVQEDVEEDPLDLDCPSLDSMSIFIKVLIR